MWKILLQNSRSIVQSLQRLSLKRANRSTKVCHFPLPFCSILHRGRVCPSFQANFQYITKHESYIDNSESLFLPKIAHGVQDLWADEIIPCCWTVHPLSSWWITQVSTFPSPLLCRSHVVLVLISYLTRSFFAEAQKIAAEDYVPSIEVPPRRGPWRPTSMSINS
jgi:hypothetical protein